VTAGCRREYEGQLRGFLNWPTSRPLYRAGYRIRTGDLQLGKPSDHQSRLPLPSCSQHLSVSWRPKTSRVAALEVGGEVGSSPAPAYRAARAAAPGKQPTVGYSDRGPSLQRGEEQLRVGSQRTLQHVQGEGLLDRPRQSLQEYLANTHVDAIPDMTVLRDRTEKELIY